VKVYGIIGWKNSGKTSLMERLVADITGRGFSVSTVKHVHHAVDLDQPGKDTFRHRQAGAREVVLASAERFALMVEHRGPEPELPAVLARLAPVDLVLVEGYKRDAHPKLEVWRAETGQPLIQAQDPLVRAVATDVGLSLPVPVLDLNDTKAVADFILKEVGLVGRSTTRADDAIDRVIIVDWSGKATRSPAKESKDSIWIGMAEDGGDTQPIYFRTRAEAEAWLAERLAEGGRQLVGFDFPMGYPAGFARRMIGQDNARVLHGWLAERVIDRTDNSNNRFEVAEGINRQLGGTGPFWGRPKEWSGTHLPYFKTVDYPSLGLPEKRQVERENPPAKPVWQLLGAGSVGSQALLGIPVVHRLALATGAAVWPFEAPRDLTLAEVYPSLLSAAVRASGDSVPDRAQVRLLARALFRLSQAGRLAPLLSVPQIAQEEGWILGAGHRALLEEALTWE
jgi:molybdopterin-guanine dinucleotide biosynthesis adapter protein